MQITGLAAGRHTERALETFLRMTRGGAHLLERGNPLTLESLGIKRRRLLALKAPSLPDDQACRPLRSWTWRGLVYHFRGSQKHAFPNPDVYHLGPITKERRSDR